MVTYTTLNKSKRRVWGAVVDYWNALPDDVRMIGTLVDSRGLIKVNARVVGKKISERASIVLIPGEKKKEQEAVGNIIGAKKRRVVLICDEMPELSHALLNAAQDRWMRENYGRGMRELVLDPVLFQEAAARYRELSPRASTNRVNKNARDRSNTDAQEPRLIYNDPCGDPNYSEDSTRSALSRSPGGLLASANSFLDGDGSGNGGSGQASQRTPAEELGLKARKDRALKELSALEKWADRNNAVLNADMFRRTVLNGRITEDPGSEHSVFHDPASKSVIKLTHADDIGDGVVGQSSSVGGYLNNLALGNELFGVGTKLAGIVYLENERPQIVTTQPFLKGRPATPKEIESFFDAHGFEKSDDGGWVKPLPDGRVIDIRDAVPANVMVVGKDVVPFDVQITGVQADFSQGRASTDVTGPADDLNPGEQAHLNEVSPQFAPAEYAGRAFVFASPNDSDTELTFDQAKGNLASQRQARFEAFSKQVDEVVFPGGTSKISGALGDWADGSENTTVAQFSESPGYENLVLSAALKGAYGNQKAVIPFEADDTGDQVIYDFFIPGAAAKDSRARLDAAGLPNRTLLEQNGGVRVLIFDENGSLKPQVLSFTENNNYERTIIIGRGEFLGSWDSREKGRQIYRAAVERGVDRIRLEGRQQGPDESLRADARAGRIESLARERSNTDAQEPRLIYNDPYGDPNYSEDSTRSALSRSPGGLLASAAGSLGYDGGGNDRATAGAQRTPSESVGLKERQQRGLVELKALEKWADKNNAVINSDWFRRAVEPREYAEAGSEHRVFLDASSNRVIKLTHADDIGDGVLGQSLNIGDYLNNLALGHELFGVNTKLAGVVYLENERPQILTTQPFLKGRPATPKEIEGFFNDHGFAKSNDGGWLNTKDERFYLDVVDIFPGIKTAAVAAKQGNQIGLFNLDELRYSSTEDALTEAGNLDWNEAGPELRDLRGKYDQVVSGTRVLRAETPEASDRFEGLASTDVTGEDSGFYPERLLQRRPGLHQSA